MTKHHAKHKKHHENSSRDEARLESTRQAGFLSFNLKRFMNKRDKFLIIAIAFGVIALFAGSVYLILNGRLQPEDPEITAKREAEVLQSKVNEKIDEMKSEIKEATVLVNSGTFNPLITTIKAGGNVGFFNEESTPITVQGYDAASEVLNIGPVAPFDIPVVVFDKAGSYKFINPENPSEVGEIIVVN